MSVRFAIDSAEARRDLELDLLASIRADKVCCERFYSTEFAPSSLSEDGQFIAGAIRDHWVKGETLPITRKNCINHPKYMDQRKPLQAKIEIEIGRLVYRNTNLADFGWKLDKWVQAAKLQAVDEKLKAVNRSDTKAFEIAKTVVNEVKAKTMDLDKALLTLDGVITAPMEGVIMTNLSTVKVQSIEWLWNDRLPISGLSILAGEPEQGKTMIAIDMIATVTQGRQWADGSPCEAGRAIIISAEDDISRVLVPRLKAAGADLTKVDAIEGIAVKDKDGKLAAKPFSLADIANLESALQRRPGVKLIVIDPLMSFMGKSDTHKDSEVRDTLGPLVKLAEKYNVCILGLTHFNKASAKGGMLAMNRVMGSKAFTGLARSVFVAISAPPSISVGEDKHFLIHGKCNYGKKAVGLSYYIDDSPKVVWDGGTTTATAEQIQKQLDGTNDSENDGKLASAKKYLTEKLATGGVSAKDVFTDCKYQGISEKTLYRAKDELGIQSRKDGKSGWRWFLDGAQPPTGETEDDNFTWN